MCIQATIAEVKFLPTMEIGIGGPSLRQEVTCRMTDEGLALQFGPRTGSYRPWWKDLAVTVHGWSGAAALSNGAAAHVDPQAQTASFADSGRSRGDDISAAQALILTRRPVTAQSTPRPRVLWATADAESVAGGIHPKIDTTQVKEFHPQNGLKPRQ